MFEKGLHAVASHFGSGAWDIGMNIVRAVHLGEPVFGSPTRQRRAVTILLAGHGSPAFMKEAGIEHRGEVRHLPLELMEELSRDGAGILYVAPAHSCAPIPPRIEGKKRGRCEMLPHMRRIREKAIELDLAVVLACTMMKHPRAGYDRREKVAFPEFKASRGLMDSYTFVELAGKPNESPRRRIAFHTDSPQPCIECLVEFDNPYGQGAWKEIESETIKHF